MPHCLAGRVGIDPVDPDRDDRVDLVDDLAEQPCLVFPLLAQLVPLGDLKSNEDTDHDDDEVEENREQVLFPDVLGDPA